MSEKTENKRELKFTDVLHITWLGLRHSLWHWTVVAQDLKILLRTPSLVRPLFRLNAFYALNYSPTRNRYDLAKSGIPSAELVYGETPFSTLEKAIKGLVPKSRQRLIFLDLGCGKGKLVFYWRLRYRAPAVGVDCISTYTQIADRLAKMFRLDKIQFIHQDMRLSKFSRAAIVWITATTLGPKTMQAITQQLLALKPGALVISVSQRIDHPSFKQVRKFHGAMHWGKAWIYVQRKS